MITDGGSRHGDRQSRLFHIPQVSGEPQPMNLECEPSGKARDTTSNRSQVKGRHKVSYYQMQINQSDRSSVDFIRLWDRAEHMLKVLDLLFKTPQSLYQLFSHQHPTRAVFGVDISTLKFSSWFLCQNMHSSRN